MLAQIDFNALDILFAIIVLFASIRCTFKGFISELMGLASIILGLGLAFAFSPLLSEYLIEYIGKSFWNQILAFLIIFLVVYVIVKILENTFYKVSEKIHLEKLDKALGFFLGIIEGLVVVAIVILVLKFQPFFSFEKIIDGSLVSRLFFKLFPYGVSNVVSPPKAITDVLLFSPRIF